MRARSTPFSLATLAFFLSLPAIASISGTVINIEGQPVAGAKVSLYAPETVDGRRARILSAKPDRAPLATMQTDSRGTFSFDSPKEPVVDLRVEAAGFAPDAVRLLSDDDAGAIALISAPMQKGTITAGGKPLAGATVVWIGNNADFEATTDADGHYTVPDPSKWGNRLFVSHPDYAPLEEFTVNEARKGVDRTLTAGIVIRGRVVAADGHTPVAKVPVAIDDWPLATTADDGTFTIAHAPKDFTHLIARNGGQAAVRARSNEGTATLRLAKAATISGIVRDAKSQMPLVGAEVRLAEANPFGRRAGAASQSVFTDAKGTFSAATVPGSYLLVGLRPNFMIPNVTVSVTAGQTVNKPLYAAQRARVIGSVVDEDKRAVAGARVGARPANRDPNFAMMVPGRFQQPDSTAYTAPDGRFVLRNVATESDLQIDAAKKGFPVGRTASLRLNPGERKSGVVITIPRGVAFSGKVIDSGSRPLSGVAVEALESSGQVPAGIRRMINAATRDRSDDVVRTGSDGTFTLRLKEGNYDVVFKRDGFAAKTLRAQAVNSTTRPVEVTLEPGVEVSGRITRAGAGVEGVNVNAFGDNNSASAVTASDGSFTLSDLTPGQMMLSAVKQDAFIQQIRPVTAPAHDVIIEVPAGGTIKGHVIDKLSKNPITSFQAGVSTSRSGGGMVIQTPPMLRSFTADDGTFTLENVPPGPTQIVVSAPGYTTAHVPGVNVEEGKAITDLEVALDTGTRLIGRVTGPDGGPVSGVSVRLDTSSQGRVIRFDGTDSAAVTDPNGEYTIAAVDPGERTFVFSRQGYLTEQRTITLSSTDARLDVQLSTGVRLAGVVVSDAGVPVADAMVNASSASEAGGGRQARTDASGNFQIEGLAPGHYTLFAAKAGYANGVLRDFDVSAGAPARIILAGGGTITGHVTGLTDTELQTAMVTANSSNGSASAAVDSGGNYRIEGAPTGTVRVAARTGQGFAAGSKTSPPRSVQVDPGGSAQVDLEFKSNVVQGRVTRNGQPLSNAMVRFIPRNAQSQTSASGTADSNGVYQVSGLDDGTYNVMVTDFQRLSPFSTTYETHGSSTFDIDIKSTSLRGRVVDSTTGDPIVDARVTIQSARGDSFFSSLAAATDSAGGFILENVPQGSYQAKAEKDGYGHDMQTVDVGDTAPSDLTFKLAQSRGVTLRVVDGRDNRLLGADVRRIVDAQGRDVDFGSFRLSNSPEPMNLPLSPGRYSVTISAMGYALKTVTVVSPGDMTVGMTPGGSLVLRSKSSTTQRVRLIDATGRPYGGGPFGGAGIFSLDPGSRTLNNIAAGTYQLQVLDARDQVVNSIPVTVVDGQQAVIDV